jgi:DNA repair protein RadD
MDFEELRDYQKSCVDELRKGVKDGHRSQILVAPTGAGKTVIAAHLLGEAYQKQSRSYFVCDRVSLVDQTSATLDRYGIQHGVIQADHWRNRPWGADSSGICADSCKAQD